MRLAELLQALPAVQGQTGDDVDIHGIVADSRQAQPGTLFIAVPGVYVDGHRFIGDAVRNGAVVVIGERSPQQLASAYGERLPAWDAFTYLRVPDAREAWGWLCAAWHHYPSRKMTVVGVTGTDGKTTTVRLTYAILCAAGLAVGMTSTVSARIGSAEIDTGLHTTTPDPPDVQRYLAQMVEARATHAVLEVTSHGLAQRRVAGCDFDVAVVTNVTHEHLDFHGSMEAYQQAKAQLFAGLGRAHRKPGVVKTAVLNRDDDSFRYLSPVPVDRRFVYTVEQTGEPPDRKHCPEPASADTVLARQVTFASDRTRFTLCTPQGETSIETPLVGAFNVSNVLAAACAGLAVGADLDAIRHGVASVRGVPGRMERIDGGQSFLALVDFAHTPNALRRALQTARTMAGEDGRLIVVFGSAGLRDQAKRGLMGREAGRLADYVFVTAEDPRTERLDEIIAESVAAATLAGKREGVDLWCVPDRGEALLRACQMARRGDVVIACGKGHEQSMCFGTVEYPWDDREAMRLALRGDALDTLPTARR